MFFLLPSLFVLSLKLSLFVFSNDFNNVSNLSLGSLESNKSLLYLELIFFSFLQLSGESISLFPKDSPKFSIEEISFSELPTIFDFPSLSFVPTSLLNPPVRENQTLAR